MKNKEITLKPFLFKIHKCLFSIKNKVAELAKQILESLLPILLAATVAFPQSGNTTSPVFVSTTSLEVGKQYAYEQNGRKILATFDGTNLVSTSSTAETLSGSGMYDHIIYMCSPNI